MTALQLLIETAPNWIKIIASSSSSLGITAEPLSPGGLRVGKFTLDVQLGGPSATVREQSIGSSLPTFCPERHINSDGSFCLGLDAGEITDSKQALAWWGKLESFLVCQTLATKHGEWPRGRGLSHGRAADIQIEMEQIALKNNWVEEVWDGIAYKENWLGSTLPRIRKNSGMLVNQRSSCPRRCSKRNRPILRCDCPHKIEVFELIRLEMNRRKIEQRYIDAYSDKKCCGTMKICPFK